MVSLKEDANLNASLVCAQLLKIFLFLEKKYGDCFKSMFGYVSVTVSHGFGLQIIILEWSQWLCYTERFKADVRYSKQQHISCVSGSPVSEAELEIVCCFLKSLLENCLELSLWILSGQHFNQVSLISKGSGYVASIFSEIMEIAWGGWGWTGRPLEVLSNSDNSVSLKAKRLHLVLNSVDWVLIFLGLKTLLSSGFSSALQHL